MGVTYLFVAKHSEFDRDIHTEAIGPFTTEEEARAFDERYQISMAAVEDGGDYAHLVNDEYCTAPDEYARQYMELYGEMLEES